MAGLRDTEASFEIQVNGIDKLTRLNEQFDKSVAAAEKLDGALNKGFNVSNSGSNSISRINEQLEKTIANATKLSEVLSKSGSSNANVAENANKTSSAMQKQLDIAEKIASSSSKIAEYKSKEASANDKSAISAEKVSQAQAKSEEFANKVALSAEKTSQAQIKSAEMSAKLEQAQFKVSEYAVKAANAQDRETAAIEKSVAAADKLSAAREKDIALAEKYQAQTAAINNNQRSSQMYGGGSHGGEHRENRVVEAMKEGASMFAPGMLVASGVIKAAETVKDLFKEGAHYNSEVSGMGGTWQTLVDGARGEGVSAKEAGNSNDIVQGIQNTSRITGRSLGLVDEGYQQMYHATESADRTKHLVHSEMMIADAMNMSDAQASRFAMYGVGHSLDRGKVNGGAMNQMVQYAPALTGALTRAYLADTQKKKMTDISDKDVEHEKGELREHIKGSEVSAKMLEDALNYLGDDKFKLAAENAQKTIPGMVRAVKNGSGRIMGEFEKSFAEPISKHASSFFGGITKYVLSDQSTKDAQNAGAKLAVITAKVGDGLGVVAGAIHKLWDATSVFRGGFADGIVSEYKKIKSAGEYIVNTGKDISKAIENIIPKGSSGKLNGFAKDLGDFTGKITGIVLLAKGMSKLPIIGSVFDKALGTLGGIVGKLPLIGGALEKIIGGNKLKNDSAANNMLRASDQMLVAAGKFNLANPLSGSGGVGISGSGRTNGLTRTSAREAEELAVYSGTAGGKFAQLAERGAAKLNTETRIGSNAGFWGRFTGNIQQKIGTIGEKIVTSEVAQGVGAIGGLLKGTGRFLGKGMPGMNALFAGVDALSVMGSTKAGTVQRDAGLGNAVGNGVGATIGGALGASLGPLGIMGGSLLGGWLGGKAGSWFGTSIHSDDGKNNSLTVQQALAQAQKQQAGEDFTNSAKSLGIAVDRAKQDYNLLTKAQESNSVKGQKFALDYQRAFESGDTKAITSARNNLQSWVSDVKTATDTAAKEHQKVQDIFSGKGGGGKNPNAPQPTDSPLGAAIKQENREHPGRHGNLKPLQRPKTGLGTDAPEEPKSPLALALENQHKGGGSKSGGGSKKPTLNKPKPPKSVLGGGGGGTSPLAEALKQSEKQSDKTNQHVKSGSKKTAGEVKKDSDGIKLNALNNDKTVLGSGKKTSSALATAAKKSSSEIKKAAEASSKGQKKTAEDAAKASVAAQKKAAQSTLKDMKKQGSDLEKALKSQSKGQKKELDTMKKQQKSALSGMNKDAQKSFKSFSKQVEDAMKKAKNSLKSGLKSMENTSKSGVKSIESKFKQLNSSIKSALNKAKNTAKSGIKSIENVIKSGFNHIGSAPKSGMNKLNSSIKSALNKAKSTAKSGSKGIGTAVKSGLKSVGNAGKSEFNKLSSTVKSGINKAKGSAKSGSVAIGNAVKNGLKNVGNAGKSEFSKLSSSVTSGMNKAKSAATAGSSGIGKAISSGMKNVSSAAKSAMNSFTSSVQSGISKAASVASSGTSKIVSSVSSGLSKLGSVSSSGFDKMSSSMSSAMSKVSSTATSGMAKVSAAVTAGMSTVTSAVQSGGAKAVSVMSSAFDKMASSGTSASAKVASSMSSIGSAASSAAARVNELAASINNLHSKTITITANVEGKGASKLATGTSLAKSVFSSIPAYAGGTPQAHRGGAALVNDSSTSDFREAFMLPNGKFGLFPNERNILVDLPKGTHVLNGADTKRKFGSNLSKYANGTSGAMEAVNAVRNRNLKHESSSQSKKSGNVKFSVGKIEINITDKSGNAKDMADSIAREVEKRVEEIFRKFNSNYIEVGA